MKIRKIPIFIKILRQNENFEEILARHFMLEHIFFLIITQKKHDMGVKY